jgi:hypothetical protein
MIYADDILAKRVKDKEKTMTLTNVTKGTMTGTIIGITGGLLFAYFRGQDVWKCMFIGGLSCGIISRIFMIKK